MNTVVLIMLMAAAPVGEEATNIARQSFQDGSRLYAAGRYREALGRFELAYKLKPHPSTLFNIARCQEQLGEVGNALRNYRAYLEGVPGATDREAVNESIVTLERKSKAVTQRLTIATLPSGAEVLVDGKTLGGSPTSVDLAPGPHQLAIVKEGHARFERSFEMPTDKALDFSFTLTPTADADLVPPPMPPPEVEASSSATPSGAHAKAWIPAAGGGALLVAGGVLYGLAKGTEARLLSGDQTLADAIERGAAVRAGQTQQTLAFVAGALGIGALLSSALMYFWPTKTDSVVSVRLAPAFGGAVLSGEFP